MKSVTKATMDLCFTAASRIKEMKLLWRKLALFVVKSLNSPSFCEMRSLKRVVEFTRYFLVLARNTLELALSLVFSSNMMFVDDTSCSLAEVNSGSSFSK